MADLLLEHRARVGSTNAELKVLAQAGAPSGTALLADVQEHGRGRRGRGWEGATGNLFLSVLLRPSLPPERVALLCLAAAVAVVRAVPGLGLTIKWPNDVLGPEGGKVAGILAELELAAGRVDFVVVGIGVNVAMAPLPTAACLQALGFDGTLDGLARAIGKELMKLAAALERTGAEAVLAPWRQHAHTLGRRVRIEGHEGVAVDVDALGALRLATERGEVLVRAGDVEMIGLG